MKVSYTICPWRVVRLLLFFVTIASTGASYGQLSDLHYLPPLKQVQGVEEQSVFFSTPVDSSFKVYMYKGTDEAPLDSVSLNDDPEEFSLTDGNNNITLVSETNTGVVLSNSGLRFVSEGGQKFYVNYRANNNAQGSSLTSKGRASLGKRFRWAAGPVTSGSNTNATLGIIASEDSTTITISGFDESMGFRLGNDKDGLTGGDNNTITKTLDAGQSFVLESVSESFPTGVDVDGWLGSLIVANKDIVVSVGSFRYGSDGVSGGGQDIAMDQIIPENVLGKQYIFVRGNGGDEHEYGIIIATQNNTAIYVNGDSTSAPSIDAGEYHIVEASNYSGTSAGSNMLVQTSKEAYAFQATAGKNDDPNVDYNFIAPVNFLLDKEVNYIPNIESLPSQEISGGISIISAASTASSVVLTEDGFEKTLPNADDVKGTTEWQTFYISGLSGDVRVTSEGSIAVGFNGASGVVGASGYFSGFETIPSIDVDVTVVGECLQDGNVTLTAPDTYAEYQWYRETVAVSGAASDTHIPSLPGSYTVGVRSTVGGEEYVSAPVDVSDCLPEVQLALTSTKSSLKVDSSLTLRLNLKYQSYFNASNAKVVFTVPSNVEITANNPSTGSWDNTTKTWTLGSLSPSDEEVLELTAKAIAVGAGVEVSASNTQTVIGSNSNALSEGNQLSDDDSETITITKGVTTIDITSPATNPVTKTVLDANFSLVASTSNTSDLSYSSSNEGVAQVDGSGEVDILNVGSTTLTLSQASDANYEAGSTTLDLTVTKVTPTQSDFADISKTFGDAPFELVAPTSDSDGAFSYTTSDASVVSIDGQQLTIESAGSAVITARQAATANYEAKDTTLTVTVAKAEQSITVGDLPSGDNLRNQVTSAPIALSATSTSGEDVTITISDTSDVGGRISGSPGSFSLDSLGPGNGNLTLKFRVDSTTNYEADSLTVDLDVDKIPQSITFSPSMDSSVAYREGLEVTITATSPSTAPMDIAVESGPATLSGQTLTITGAGNVVFRVNNPGDETYTAASEVRRTLRVSQGETTLSEFSIANKTYGDGTVAIPSPTSNRSGDYVYSSSDPTVASVEGSNLKIYTAGTTSIRATQLANDDYQSDTLSTTLTVDKADPVLSGLSDVSKVVTSSEFNLGVSSSSSSSALVYASSDPSVATIDASTGVVSLQSIGTTTLTVTQAASANYNAASGSAILTVVSADAVVPTIPASQVLYYQPNGPVGDTLGMVTASDNVGITAYSIVTVTGPDGQDFSTQGWMAVNSSGVVTLTSAGVGSVLHSPSQGANAFTMAVQVSDQAGNTASANVRLIADGEAPTLVSEPPIRYPEGRVAGEVATTIEATDNYGIASLAILEARDTQGQDYSEDVGRYFILNARGELSMTEAGERAFVNDVDQHPNALLMTFRVSDVAGNTLTEILRVEVTNATSFTDTDGDEVPDYIENAQSTDPEDADDYRDTDGDGVPDYVESSEEQAVAMRTDPLDASSYLDRDCDGVPDYVERKQGSDEIRWWLALDTDGDGVPDYVEQREGTDELDDGAFTDADGDGVADYVAMHRDTDGDGVPDRVEETQGTDPRDRMGFVDTDGDGVSDHQEGCNLTDPEDASDYLDVVSPVVGATPSRFNADITLYAQNRRADEVVATVDVQDAVGVVGIMIDSVVAEDTLDVTQRGWFGVGEQTQVVMTAAGVASAANSLEEAPNRFTLYVRAYDAAGNRSSSSGVAIALAEGTGAVEPIAPTDEAGLVQVDPLVMHWQGDPLATHYHLQVSADTFRTVMVADTVTDTTATMTGLAYESAYHWRVRAANAYSTGPWSAPHGFTTELTPVKGVGLILPAQNGVDIDVPTLFTWHPVEHADKYEFMLFSDSMLTTVVQTHLADTSIVIDTLQANTNYLYRVRAKNATSKSNWTNHEFTTAATDSGDGDGGVVTSTEDTYALPTAYNLSQNYPNPFNPTTVIRYALPQASQVTLEVFDMVGRQVATLAEGPQAAGYHTATFDGRSLASGAYIYRLRAVNQATGQPFVHTRTLVLIK